MTAQTTATIATFIRDRLDADEAAARAMSHNEGCWPGFDNCQEHNGSVAYEPGNARVLAQVAAIRAIVEDQAGIIDNPETYDNTARTNAEEVLRALASIWADDPGWQEAWR